MRIITQNVDPSAILDTGGCLGIAILAAIATIVAAYRCTYCR